jgi:hypothetical protein
MAPAAIVPGERTWAGTLTFSNALTMNCRRHSRDGPLRQHDRRAAVMNDLIEAAAMSISPPLNLLINFTALR